MGNLISGFLSNDSVFGKLMTRLGIIIAANLMFVLFSFPVLTAGAAYTALYHVMFKTLRGDGVINPFKQFWIGFKNNFKQSTICWLVLLVLLAFGYMDVTLCQQAGGFLRYFIYGLYALGIAGLIIALYLFPTMAAFSDTIPHLIRNAIYFALHNIGILVIIVFFHVFPMILTYSDLQMLPLYAFIWITCGYSLIVLLSSKLLLKEFVPYLPAVDACGDFILDEEDEALWADRPDVIAPSGGGAPVKSEAEILEEMKKLGM